MASNSLLLNVAIAPISDAMDVDQIVTQAQELLQLEMKAQEKEWME